MLTTMACPKCGWDQGTADQCPSCGVVFKRLGATRARPAPRPPVVAPDRDTKKTIAIVIGIAAAVALCGAIFVVLLLNVVRRSEPYQMVAALIRSDEGIGAVVGPDPKLGFWFTGSVETTSGGGGTARFAIPVHGSAGSTRVQAVLRRKANQWTVLRAVYPDMSGATRSLNGITPPTDDTDTADAADTADSADTQGSADADAHFDKAQALYAKRDFAAAWAEYDHALTFDPSAAHARHGRGLSAMQMGDDDRALADFRELIRLEPAKIEWYHLLDQVLSRRQAWDEIIDAWTSFIALQPDSARAYLERGGAYSRKKEMANARADAEKACALGNQQGCDIGRRFAPQ
jgi:cytochrome oxidase complex assembly protein 1/tetratricopeptide repeat protein